MEMKNINIDLIISFRTNIQGFIIQELVIIQDAL